MAHAHAVVVVLRPAVSELRLVLSIGVGYGDAVRPHVHASETRGGQRRERVVDGARHYVEAANLAVRGVDVTRHHVPVVLASRIGQDASLDERRVNRADLDERAADVEVARVWVYRDALARTKQPVYDLLLV